MRKVWRFILGWVGELSTSGVMLESMIVVVIAVAFVVSELLATKMKGCGLRRVVEIE